ncbi:DGQHR domain-containing protein [Heliobacterium undosum]|uniref:DGQHR domain-containing protein n=1 Tax=Heliomicrobium undosum TaxID=121734 RepID=A0A845L7J1_9FIRM|nr:DGQHR domain-containing protein [Heliomicrobium undosum]MZP28891.1 DGQHR domain-containing protein [Heliomicrobium undosum]
MKEYITSVFKYRQNNQEYLSCVLPFDVINKISKVLVYGEDIYGYQRKLNRRHYSNIKKKILEDNLLLPTSIILSANSDYIYSLLIEDGYKWKLAIRTDEKEFRIVDGQHRIKGLEEAAKIKTELNDFLLNVIVLVTEPNKRDVEVDVFRDINSFAKRIKTDLTLLANYNYELINQKEIENISEHISVKTAFYLNEKTTNSVWHKAIQFDFNNDLSSSGIIGVRAFVESINIIAEGFVKREDYIHLEEKDILINFAEIKAEELANFINKAWDIVRQKWGNCFKEAINEDMFEYSKTFYDQGYYLQKTTGVNAIHKILHDLIIELGYGDATVERFSKIISCSKVRSDDWQVGSIFSGLTSNQGFNKARDIILNRSVGR